MLAAALIAILAAVYLIAGGYYPILTVNGTMVSEHKFQKNYAAALRYAKNAQKTYEHDASLSILDIESQILNSLVEAALIEQALRKEVGGDMEMLVDNKLQKFRAEENQNFAKAVETLYGLSVEEFEAEVMRPQAEKDVWEGRLFLQGEKMDIWFVQAKAAASVNIFSNKFEWNGKEIVKK